ncbi:MAG TPA: CDP-alcohol phosphatidyltransferase family protein [Alphaproteobacteria bacterium]|jgi:phosphatidylglycerophosphate synthase
MSGLPYDQRIANRIVRVLAPTPVTPNMVTTFGLVCGVAAALLYATGERLSVNLAAVMFMIAVLNDHIDGSLARATGRTSKFGHYYDHFAVGVAYIGMFVGAGIGLRNGWLGEWASLLGVIAGAAVTVIFMTRIAVEVRAGKDYVRQNNYGGFEVEDILYVVGPVTWFGLLEPFLVAAAVGAPLFLLWVIWRSRRDIARAVRERRAS